MRAVSIKTLTYAIALGGMTAVVAQPAMAKDKKEQKAAPELSKEFRKAALPVQEAIAAQDFATAASALPAAEALAKTPDEKYIAAKFRLRVAVNAKDQAGQVNAVETILASGKAEPGELPSMYFYSGNFAYVDGKYEKASTQVAKAMELGYTENNAALILADSYLKLNRLDDAFKITREAIAAKRATGETVPEDWFNRSASAAQKAGRMDDLIDFLALRLQSYNTPEYWRNTALFYLKTTTPDKATTLDALRLMAATSALKTRAEFYEWANLSIESGLPGEAVTAYQAGIKSGQVQSSDSEFATLNKQQTAKIAADKAEVAKSEKNAATAADGKTAKGTGDALFGYGDYARAAALYRLAAQKGGVELPLVNLRLGMALAMSGDYAAAKQAFATVYGPRAGLARLWSAYADMKMVAPTAAVPVAG